MKLGLKFIFILFLQYPNIYSQKGIVRYGYIEAFQIGDNKGYDYNAYLVFDKNQSYYVTAKDSLEKSEKTNEQKTLENEKNGGKLIHLGAKVSKSGDQVIQNIQKKTTWSSLYCGNIYYIKEITPKIEWKISRDSKEIGKFTCKKATTFFRGRQYTAWFTNEIPVPFGPWKLQGLPGLILEAYDTEKYVHWYFKNVEYPSKTKEAIKYLTIPQNKEILNYNEFKKFQTNQIEKVGDKLKLAKKQFPDVDFFPPKLNEMFIECELL